MRNILLRGINFLPYRLRLSIKDVPVVAALQRIIISRFLSNRPFTHDIDAGPAAGLRFEVTLPRDKAVWMGTYEDKFTDSIAKNIEEGDVCYDIGGYRGYMAGVMALAGARSVLVFEPLPANQEALRRLCELNPKLPIHVIAAAIGRTDGEAVLKIMSDGSMGKLASSPFQTAASAVAELSVKVFQIDSLVQRRDALPPDLIKIDVEGAELDVLLGALNTLRASRPKIFLEAHSNALEKACTEQLLLLGYRVHRIEHEIFGEESARHLIGLP